MHKNVPDRSTSVTAPGYNLPPETFSNTVANTSTTTTSAGSDLNGMAIQHACQQQNARLAPYRQIYGPDATLKTLAHAAYPDRVNLSANGFYKTPTIGYKWGNYVDPLPMYFYFTQGAAISEVEPDVLTGSNTVLRTDIKMDVGSSINPAIDYGQIDGAFVQGQGLFTRRKHCGSRMANYSPVGPEPTRFLDLRISRRYSTSVCSRA